MRNHDELSLAHLDANLTKSLQSALLPFGVTFREGHGVSGRTYSLLNRNLEKFKMAYLLLFSFPGSVMINLWG